MCSIINHNILLFYLNYNKLFVEIKIDKIVKFILFFQIILVLVKKKENIWNCLQNQFLLLP